MTRIAMVVSGPSGVGKGTVLRAWEAIDERIMRAVSHTTRAPRPGEQAGVDYHFISDTLFDQMADDGLFADQVDIFQARYGLSIGEIERVSAAGRVPLIEVDATGALRLQDRLPGCTTVFLTPPTREALQDRLARRRTETPVEMQARLSHSTFELSLARHFQVQIANTDVEATVAALKDLLDSLLLRDAGQA